MDAAAPLDTTLGRIGLIAAALLAAAAVLSGRPRLRAAALAGAYGSTQRTSGGAQASWPALAA